jgi:hypothetical protein
MRTIAEIADTVAAGHGTRRRALGAAIIAVTFVAATISCKLCGSAKLPPLPLRQRRPIDR